MYVHMHRYVEQTYIYKVYLSHPKQALFWPRNKKPTAGDAVSIYGSC